MAMELFNGVVMRTRTRTRPGLFFGAPRVSLREFNRISCQLNYPKSTFSARPLRRRVVGGISAFDDKRHMEYYASCCTDERKEEGNKKKKKKKDKVVWSSLSEKKRAKLVKELTKNLNMLSELGFGLETDQPKVNTISEAALVLQAHLEHLRTEGEKLEKRREMPCLEGMTSVLNDSSSSSSESSDSECDNDEAGNMSILRNKLAAEVIVGETIRSEGHETMVQNLEQNCSSSMDASSGQQQQVMKRVEVCMGGKCKKMGAPVLMEEFQNVLGVGGSVVGCKCLGKCKTAPNLRIFNAAAADDNDNEEGADDSVRSPRNPLHLGVGLDDVGFIVANYFGSEQRQVGSEGVSLNAAAAAVSPSP